MKFILCGFKQCGKTSFGKILAKDLELPFIDVDALIQKAYKARTGEDEKIFKIYLKLGERSFREYEARAILALQETPVAILALGGGSVLDERVRKHLPKIGKVIYLDVPKEIIKKRILAKIPAYLLGKDPDKGFDLMFETRLPLFKQVATVSLSTQGKSNTQILHELKEIYGEQ